MHEEGRRLYAHTKISGGQNMIERKGHILIIDDDPEMRSLLRDFFASEHYRVTDKASAKEALTELLGKGGLATRSAADPEDLDLDVIVSDIKMPGMSGLEFVPKVKQAFPQLPIILATAFGSIESAIEAIRLGAFDYVTKPLKLVELQVTVDRALAFRRLHQENKLLKKQAKERWTCGNLVGKSKAMLQVFDLIARIAPSSANVLIMGESGTGKEQVARAIHNQSSRAKHPFVAINCSAIPDALLESELFGHTKGAFTGAAAARRGLLADAQGGTVFFDEIGDMSLSVQVKLLRVIQERKIKPVGQNTEIDIDVRILAATHKDLKAAAKDGNFREDLYYRLCVIPVLLPPLRHRPDDIPLLVEHFLRNLALRNNPNVKGIAPKALARLMAMRWEGNVRELENVLERAVVLCQGELIDECDLPSEKSAALDDFIGQAQTDLVTLEELEIRYVQYVLAKTGGKKEQAAQILGINRRTLYRWEKEVPPETEE